MGCAIEQKRLHAADKARASSSAFVHRHLLVGIKHGNAKLAVARKPLSCIAFGSTDGVQLGIEVIAARATREPDVPAGIVAVVKSLSVLMLHCDMFARQGAHLCVGGSCDPISHAALNQISALVDSCILQCPGEQRGDFPVKTEYRKSSTRGEQYAQISAARRMRSHGVVVRSPLLDQHLRLVQRLELLFRQSAYLCARPQPRGRSNGS